MIYLSPFLLDSIKPSLIALYIYGNGAIGPSLCGLRREGKRIYLTERELKGIFVLKASTSYQNKSI